MKIKYLAVVFLLFLSTGLFAETQRKRVAIVDFEFSSVEDEKERKDLYLNDE